MKYISIFLLAFCVKAQNNSTPSDKCAANVNYSYFAETGAAFDYYAKSLASTTGFGLRIGCSNAFSVTNIDTPIGQGSVQYATLRTGIEYHVVNTGNFEFIGFGTAGATTNGSTSTSSFSGGASLSYNIGNFLTKNKISLPIVFEYGIQAITSTEVKPIYRFMFRKTF